MYKVKSIIKSYTVNTTITDLNFGGWQVVNTGTDDIMVNKILLEPGQGLDYTDLDPDVVWDSPIQIVILNPGGEATITMLQYKLIKK